MYNSDSAPHNGKILLGIVLSLLILISSKIGVFSDLYSASAVFFKDFQTQNMEFFKGINEDFQFITNLGNLKKENDDLKSQNQKLNSENVVLQNRIDELSLLIKQESSFGGDYEYIPVRIMQYSESQTEIIISKGSNDGVIINDVLVLDNCLLGLVIETKTTYSKAKLIISSDSKVSAITNITKLKGIATGDGINQLILNQVPNDKKLTTEEHLLTAGVDGVFPYGLIIGKISKVESNDTDILQKAQVTTDLNIKNLMNIFIIRKK